jgi:DNA ligase-1
MLFSEFVKYLRALESTSSRIEKQQLLYLLLQNLEPKEREAAIRLLCSEYGVLGIGEGHIKNALASLAKKEVTTAVPTDELPKHVLEAKETSITVEQMDGFMRMFETMNAEGIREHSAIQEVLTWLYNSTSPEDAVYATRFLLGKTRIGVQKPTIIEVVANFYGVDINVLNEHAARRPLYAVVADLEAKKPLASLKSVCAGSPFVPMLAQKANSEDEILLRMKNIVAEWKLDGERVQIHKNGDEVRLFSRRLTDITEQYPEIVEAVKKNFADYNELVLDGEIVAVNPHARDELLPFQVLMRRKRIYDVEQYKEVIPAVVYVFDILSVNGEDLTKRKYAERRQKLREVVGKIPLKDDRIRLVPSREIKSVDDLREAFRYAKMCDMEGLVVKDLDAPYEVGVRSPYWMKLKGSYISATNEFDLVVVGGFYGEGKRAGTYGSLLLACRNPQDETLETVARVGSGFTDEDLELMKTMFKVRDSPPEGLKYNIAPDVWFEPEVVVEVIADDITVSSVHTAGGGYSLRFPRFIRWRPDKSKNEATTTQEIVAAYDAQRRSEKKAKANPTLTEFVPKQQITEVGMRVYNLADKLKQEILPYCKKVEVAGSIRRKKPEPRDIDIVVVPKDEVAKDAIKNKLLEKAQSVRLVGDKEISVVVDNTQVDVYFTDEVSYGAMLLFLTGPNVFNISMRKRAKDMGYLLNQWGLFDRRTGKLIASTEEGIFKALGMYYEPPELRGMGGQKLMKKLAEQESNLSGKKEIPEEVRYV